MDKWKYFDITHKRHVLCNPMSQEKLDRFCKILRLPRDPHVLDIACGKGEYLIRLAEIYGVSGVGVDLSPFCIKDCREKHRERIPEANLEFIEMDGADYQPKANELFDLSMCLGASWVFKDHYGTLQALTRMTKSGGLVVAGEPYWLKDPEDEYLEMTEMTRESFRSHNENVLVGEKMGLTCLYTLVSNQDDWDHYETLQWLSVNEHIQTYGDDPDNKEILEGMEKAKEIYLRWGRDTINWAIYIFKTP